MTTLSAIMLTITASMTVIMVPRIYGDWLRLREYVQNGDLESILSLQRTGNSWVLRNFGCALMAIGMVAFIEYSPSLEGFEQLQGVMAVYAIISLFFAFVDSLLVQKIAAFSMNELEPVQEEEHE